MMRNLRPRTLLTHVARTTTYTRLWCSETMFLFSFLGAFIAAQHLDGKYYTYAIVVQVVSLLASLFGLAVMHERINNDLHLPHIQHLHTERDYHILMGFALASVPGSLLGALGGGTGLVTGFLAWIICTFPMTGLVLYEEYRRFLLRRTSSDTQRKPTTSTKSGDGHDH